MKIKSKIPYGRCASKVLKEPLKTCIFNGLKLPELAAEFGVSVSVIRDRINKYWGTTIRGLKKWGVCHENC